jgi:hypothetical protein
MSQKITRNGKCPCGSGKKFKKCCLAKAKVVMAAPPEKRIEVMVNQILGKPTNEPA